MEIRSYYELLHVDPSATAAEIRRAYRDLVRRYHPDLGLGTAAQMALINEAYAVLSDQARRDAYDREQHRRSADAAPGTTTKGANRMSEKPRTTQIGLVVAPPSFHQLGLLVLDGSGSMSEPAAGNITKAQAVNVAVREMLTRFKASRHVRNFSFAVVSFDEDAAVHTPITAATAIDDYADYDPLNGRGGGTRIAAGLESARTVAAEFLRREHPVPPTVVIVLMSDGRDGEGGLADPRDTLRLAEEIKRTPHVTICTTYFARVGSVDPPSQEHLRSIATNPETGYKTVYDAETLRRFFIASLSARAV